MNPLGADSGAYFGLHRLLVANGHLRLDSGPDLHPSQGWGWGDGPLLGSKAQLGTGDGLDVALGPLPGGLGQLPGASFNHGVWGAKPPQFN